MEEYQQENVIENEVSRILIKMIILDKLQTFREEIEKKVVVRGKVDIKDNKLLFDVFNLLSAIDEQYTIKSVTQETNINLSTLNRLKKNKEGNRYYVDTVKQIIDELETFTEIIIETEREYKGKKISKSINEETLQLLYDDETNETIGLDETEENSHHHNHDNEHQQHN